jgi:hypothetical protein
MKHMLAQLVEYFNFVNKIIGTSKAPEEGQQPFVSQSVHLRNSSANLTDDR